MEYEMCVEDHVVHRMIELWLSMARMAALFEGVGADVVAQAQARTEDCLRFELELTFSSAVQTYFDAGWFDVETFIDDSATFSVDVHFSGDKLAFMRSSAPMESVAPSYVVVGTECQWGDAVPWTESADFVDWAGASRVMSCTRSLDTSAASRSS